MSIKRKTSSKIEFKFFRNLTIISGSLAYVFYTSREIRQGYFTKDMHFYKRNYNNWKDVSPKITIDGESHDFIDINADEHKVVFKNFNMDKNIEFQDFHPSLQRAIIPSTQLIQLTTTANDRVLKLRLCKPGQEIEHFMSYGIRKTFKNVPVLICATLTSLAGIKYYLGY